MCGRVIQSSGPLRYGIVEGLDVHDSRVHNYPPHWNAAPSQELLVIRRNHQTGEVSLDPLRWGLIPYWCQDPKGGRKPINAKCETVNRLPMFRDAYRRRRCILPVDGFYEWKAIKGQKAKQPYAIAMKTASHSVSVDFGRTGRIRHRASGSARSLSSLPMPMGWSPKFTTACR
jgi:putative SOS response-associated peptidase YedK